MNKKVLFLPAFALLFLVAVLCGTASASIDQISYPYNNEIINSATIDLNYSSTGSASCYWNYNNGHNYTISCGGDKIRLPKTNGDYILTISDNTYSQKSVSIILIQPSASIIVFFSVPFMVFIIVLIYLLLSSLLKAIALQMDVNDLAFNWGGFFGVCAIYILSLEYLGSPTIQSFFLTGMEITGITNFLIPSILFIIVSFKNRMSGNMDDDLKRGDGR